MYHRKQGLILVGTDLGSLSAYGEGFQYSRVHEAAIADAPGVSQLLAVSDGNVDVLLVVYGDNSLALLSLPELNTLATLPSSWLLTGDITCARQDEGG